MWIHRNEIIHGASLAKQLHNHRLIIEEQVRIIYGNQPAVGRQHENLLNKSISTILNKPTTSLHAWIQSVQTAHEIHQYKIEKAKSLKQKITKWFRPTKDILVATTKMNLSADKLEALTLTQKTYQTDDETQITLLL